MLSWQYVAGFMDGEGSAGMTSNHNYGYSPRIQLAQSGSIGVEVLTRIQEWLLVTQGIVSRFYSQAPRNLSKLTLHRLVISKRSEAVKFLEGVLPYVITKKVEVQDLLRQLTLFPALPKGGKLSWEGRIAKEKQC